MALPASGAISLNAVNVELNRAGTTQISLNEAAVRTLFAISSGQIAMSNGYGKSFANPPTVSSYSSTPANVCMNIAMDQYIDWYVATGGSVSVTLERAAINTCSWQNAGGLGTVTTPAWVSINAASYHPGGNAQNMAFRLNLSNNHSMITSPAVGVVYDNCESETFCSQGNCANLGQVGCYNCSEVCACDPCYYDTNCDGVQGYGTNGCGASCNCDWCSWWLYWPDPNPDYPCPGSCDLCYDTCTCPCGETCPPYTELQTCDAHSGYWFNGSYSTC